MRIAEKDPQLKKAVSRLIALSEDEQTRLLAESREKLQRDIVARENAAKKEGWEAAQLTVARRLLSRGAPIDEIVSITELSPEAIRTLH
ncbi:hypothetical protein AGMMS49545_15350 [Betaproteobacteria bacterium]|nr:hypothetical protein AGMMS49545_15350 [Betaproteobacteria bacterium]GHU46015.1 hypothetical protein AGMMS50289_18430 [Betaproteobacteria bacterium]